MVISVVELMNSTALAKEFDRLKLNVKSGEINPCCPMMKTVAQAVRVESVKASV